MNVETADFSAEALFALPPDCVPDAVTSDGHVVAFWPQPDGRLRFVWDGTAGEPFDGFLEMPDKTAAIFSSDDGAHLAFVGMRGNLIFVGRDGGEDPSVESFSRSVPPVFSRGGMRLAYGARRGDDVRLIVDGHIVGEHPIAPIEAVFSPDGERLAYAEVRQPPKGQPEFRIVLDGVAGLWFCGMRNAVGAMQFSPGSRRFAYYRVDGEGHCQWIVDDVAQRLANEIPLVSLARVRHIGALEARLAACFSPDSRRFAYFADVVEKGVAIVEDDVPGPLFKAVGMPVFSPDSQRLAYVALTNAKKLALVVDGVSLGEWPATDAGEPLFSADGRHVAITLQRDEGNILRKRHMYTLAVDGHAYPEESGDDISLLPAFSPDGDRIAWWVRRGAESILLVNGSVHRGPAALASDPRYTATGHLTHVGRVGNSVTVVFDDRLGPLADGIGPLATTLELTRRPQSPRTGDFLVSPDGEHVAWAGQFGESARPVIDDRVGPAFDHILNWTFDEAGAVTWCARRGAVVYRVTA